MLFRSDVRIDFAGVETIQALSSPAILVTGSADAEALTISAGAGNTWQIAGTRAGVAFAPLLIPNTITPTLRLGDGDSLTLMDGAQVVLDQSQQLAALSLSGTSRATLAGGPEMNLLVDNLIIADQGVLDIGEGMLIVRGCEAPAETLAALTGLIFSARAGGLWSGVGIRSGAISPAMELAAVLNHRGDGQPLCEATGGIALLSDDILVRRALAGDLNLNGSVDGDDYFTLDQGFLTREAGWLGGDVNSDGQVDAADYFAADRAYLAQGQLVTGAAAPRWPAVADAEESAEEDEGVLGEAGDVLE